MLNKYCVYCGTSLKIIDGKKLCPNCGIIDEEEIEIENPDRSYLG